MITRGRFKNHIFRGNLSDFRSFGALKTIRNVAKWTLNVFSTLKNDQKVSKSIIFYRKSWKNEVSGKYPGSSQSISGMSQSLQSITKHDLKLIRNLKIGFQKWFSNNVRSKHQTKSYQQRTLLYPYFIQTRCNKWSGM